MCLVWIIASDISKKVGISKCFDIYSANKVPFRLGRRYAGSLYYLQQTFGIPPDLVIWDSHPLALGATPTQVYIDGIAQIELPYVVRKHSSLQSVPKVPNFDREAAQAISYEGLPPLLPDESHVGDVIFKNVKSIFLPEVDGNRIRDVFAAQNINPGVAVVRNGSIACVGTESSCSATRAEGHDHHVRIIDLQGGSISPSLVSYGTALGLSEIQGELSTRDGYVFDPLVAPVSPTAERLLVRAVDGLQFAGRDALFVVLIVSPSSALTNIPFTPRLAYRAGVTRAIATPSHNGFLSGLGVEFSLGARHKLERGAVHEDVTGLHVSILHGTGQPSVSTQIAALRQWLYAAHAHEEHDEASMRLADAVRVRVHCTLECILLFAHTACQGRIPLVVETHSADVIATLIALKREFETHTGYPLRLTITGATEAHLLASELAEAGVGVVLVPTRPFPETWQQQRM
jgi:hypothetical protein